MPSISLPAAIIGAGVVSAGAGLAASSNAANVASSTAAENNALQQQTYEKNSALIQPSVDRGNAAADELQGFLGLGGDPAATQAAFNTYLNSTGFQFANQTALDGVEQSKAAEGLYNSGAAQKALASQATNDAETYGQNYASDLSGVAATGQSGVNALVGAGTNNANAQSSNNNNAATVTANAGISAAQSTTSLINSAINAFGSTRGASSFGTPQTGSSNAFANWG